VKGSRYKGNEKDIMWIVFPYKLMKNRYVAILENELSTEYPKTYQYFLNHKKELESRDLDKGVLWYEFGRSQGVQTIHQEKIVLSTMINGSVSFYHLPKEILIYSGIFIVKNNSFSDWKIIEEVLQSDDFYKYIQITGKDFSGGYKSITTKQIKEYRINFKNPQLLF
jgi:putative site-specific DNA-methyltransferase restriction-modification protein